LNRQPLLWLRGWLFLACLLFPQLLLAETATLEVFHLPLHEAEAAVKSQLSEHGSVVTLPSRRMLIVTDSSKHIREARNLLKKLDVAAPQYAVSLEIMYIRDEQMQALNTEAELPGGWIKLALTDKTVRNSRRQSFNLQLTANRKGSIETGTLQPYRQHVRQWLAGYGLTSAGSVELLSVTSGFFADVRPAGSGRVHLRIEPWMRNQRASVGIRGETEILPDLGTTGAPRLSPSGQAPVRLNANPAMSQNGVIEIAGAATELTIPLGKTVTIMSHDKEAAMLGEALLSGNSTTGTNHFVIRLLVEQR